MSIKITQEDNAVPLRTRLRQLRAALPDDQRRRGALLMRGRLYTWLGLARDAALKAGRPAPSIVAAYWPLQDEPDLRPLLEQWVEAGITVALPAVRERGQPLEFRPWTPDAPMAEGPYGIQEPLAGTAVLPDLVLVPTLGYTPLADRVGYGGGYYDRTLAAFQAAGHACTRIGVAWSCGRLDPIAHVPQPHDVRLDAVLTPDGWVPKAP
ncbi:5-formyltetrahydrofolate cyclo-ligase [Bordetella genomosp. 10]|uniref:5-formyltetrahydrofolate cyclo-ligase n=1 Tax=Bordetella genomosp. 10 TaxID=1416804 RepID=A0A261S5C6_9BORD|nr:5-formyltetrahydrofolate cyclo-ligase [Bordetella genomosp. 10]OZI31990.1 5-formyltetrahydrofolate cyclo-ligase [Bordetella genomosp. 10]